MEQGAAFARTINATQPFQIAEAAYPVAVGQAARAAGMAPAMVLPLFLQAIATNLIHAGIRLIPLGQTDGQRILTALQPLFSSTAQEAETATLDEIGTAMVLTDIASARHEAQYSRIFRS
jgi:urease accessory protein